MTSVLLVDNYDSFTYNLAQALGALGASVDVVRADDAQRIRAERARESRDLVGSLAPDVQRREERAELRRGRLTGHHGPHRRLRLGSGQRLARPDEAEGLTRVQGSSPA